MIICTAEIKGNGWIMFTCSFPLSFQYILDVIGFKSPKNLRVITESKGFLGMQDLHFFKGDCLGRINIR